MSSTENKPKHIPNKLKDEVAAKYRLKIIRPGKHVFAEYGTIDLRKIDLKKADALVEKGFPYLVEIPKKDSPKK